MTNAFFIKWFPSLRDKPSELALVKCLPPASGGSARPPLAETKRCLQQFFWLAQGSGGRLIHNTSQKSRPKAFAVPFICLLSERRRWEGAFSSASAKLPGASPVAPRQLKQPCRTAAPPTHPPEY